MMKLQNYVDSIRVTKELAGASSNPNFSDKWLRILLGHSIDARAEGESEQRLYVLDAWRGVPFYRDMERAALTHSIAWIKSLAALGYCRAKCTGPQGHECH